MEQKLRQRIALNMKVERAKKRFTQEKLAELAEVSTKHITKIEKACRVRLYAHFLLLSEQ